MDRDPTQWAVPERAGQGEARKVVRGVEVDTLFYEQNHQPPLGPEYQFELDLADGRAAFDRLIAFFRHCTQSPPGRRPG